MRKHIRLLALALVPLMVVACQKPNTSSEVSSSDSSIISSLEESTSNTTSGESSVSSSTSSSSSSTSSSVSSSSSSSNVSSSSEIPSSSSTSSSSSSMPHAITPEEIELGEIYEAHYWDETIKSIAKRALGDSWNKVPEFIAPSYNALLKKEAKDGQEVLVMEVACYGVNPKSCSRLYSEKMEERGFYISNVDGYSYGYQMEDYYHDLFVSFEIVEDKDPYFLISAFIKKDREETWESEFVNLYTGMELPAFEAQCYTTNYDSQRDTLHIYAMFVDRQTAVTTYVNQLVKEGFTVTGTDNYGVTTLVDEEGYLTIQLYMTVGDYNCDALYIILNNKWPNVYIASFIGATSFPKLESDTALYDGYAFVDSKGQGLDKDITLCLYYKQASSVDFGGYVTQLTNIGMSKGDMISYEDNDTYAVPMTYVGGGLSIKVNVMYRTSMNMICIIIYQAIDIK